METSYPSICIPRVFKEITKNDIYETFSRILGHNVIERIDLVSKNKDEENGYNRVFVHVFAWPEEGNVANIRERLINNQPVNIVYKEPWFWKCSASRVAKPEYR
jgi:hypothetical protein